MLAQLLLAATDAAEATKNARSQGSSGTQEAIDNALWQYPVAALVLFVVVLFLRYMKKEREAADAARQATAEAAAEERANTNQLDQEERERRQQRFTDTLLTVQERGDNERRFMVESFTKSQEEATKNQSTLTARAIDTIDRNTEAFGKVSAYLQSATNQVPAVSRRARRTLEDEDGT